MKSFKIILFGTLIPLILLGSAPVFGKGNVFTYAQLKHQGNWDPYPRIHKNILETVKKMTNISFEPNRVIVDLDDKNIFATPFLIIKGDSKFTISKSERIVLKIYIDRGGLVFFVDTLCDANSPFSKSVRQLMLDLHPYRLF